MTSADLLRGVTAHELREAADRQRFQYETALARAEHCKAEAEKYREIAPNESRYSADAAGEWAAEHRECLLAAAALELIAEGRERATFESAADYMQHDLPPFNRSIAILRALAGGAP